VELEIYLNLASRMKVRGPNQLWIADITYIRLKAEFVYLAVVLDAFSRKVVGWSLDRSLQASLSLNALKQAIADRHPPPGPRSSFGPGRSVCLRRLRSDAWKPSNDTERKSAWESV
jgi:transposase InsO family protein